MAPYISVIIPVYNSEKTIRACLDSLLISSEDDVEIILINDGSTDLSKEICVSYADKNKTIHYYEKDNGGVSSARNMGLDIATGEYIAFVDSDDRVTDDYFTIIRNTVKDSHCDMIQFSYTIVKHESSHTRVFKPVIRKSREAFMPDIVNSICRKRINQPWAKLYRRDIIENNQIRFPLGASIAEDRVFNIKYTFYIQSYCATDKAIYYVNIGNENSLSRRKLDDTEKHIKITSDYFRESLDKAPITASEKNKYIEAMNVGAYRFVYHEAKILHKDNVEWLKRQMNINKLCTNVNKRNMKYPNTLFCILIVLPIKLHLTVVIDALAWKLSS